MAIRGWFEQAVDRFRGRARLLRLLPKGGVPTCATVVTIHLVESTIPAGIAMAVGNVVSTVTNVSTRGLTRPTVLASATLVGLVLGMEVLGRTRQVCALILARRVDGALRSTLRALATAPAGIEHLETEVFQDEASRASDDGRGFGRTRSPGTAATGQLAVAFRFLGAGLAALVVARFSIALAVLLFLVALLIGGYNRQRFIESAAVRDAMAGAERRAGYWAGLAGTEAFKEVRLFDLAGWILARRRAAEFRAGAPHWRAGVALARGQWVTITTSVAAAVLAIGVPAAATLTGELEPAAMVRSIVAGGTVLAISRMGVETFDIDYGLGAVRALDALSARLSVTTVASRAPVRPPAERPATVRFEDVSFGYPQRPGRLVLDHLSLTLRPAETIALVGRNGTGKTTLVQLLAGLYQPTCGSITVDGVDLRELDPVAWRRTLAAVFQDSVRYPATAAENVALAAPESLGDLDGIVDAVERADAAAVVDGLPHGLATSLWREGSAGVDLSGGQWQRLAIARALFAVAHGRRLLLLDEPTAQLDVQLEATFHQRVVAEVRDRVTTVLISHRLSTVRPADRIVLLDHGAVAEEGSHDELMELGGEYRRLYQLQASRFGEPAGAGAPGRTPSPAAGTLTPKRT